MRVDIFTPSNLHQGLFKQKIDFSVVSRSIKLIINYDDKLIVFFNFNLFGHFLLFYKGSNKLIMHCNLG